MGDITTITLVKYKGFQNKFWALSMMQFAHKHLKDVDGLKFYKLLGSGKAGFKPQPDWSTYALLQVWSNEEAAKAFFESSTLINKYNNRSEQLCKIYLKSIAAHGLWSGQKPFVKSDTLSITPKAIAIITRASIKTSELKRFWKYVPHTQSAIENANGLLYTKGFGEFPIWEMATFSIWDSLENAKTYAYSSKEHAKAVKMTRQYDWYKEELFSRFEVYKVDGKWAGLEDILI